MGGLPRYGLAMVVGLAVGGPLAATQCEAQDEAASPDKGVSFAKQVAPVLVAQCMGCHGAERPRAGLSMVSFNRLMRGGQRGQAIVAGNAAGSLLIRKLRGMEGKRMPLERPALPAATIELFEQWIAMGARFDGSEADSPLGRVVAEARASDVPDEAANRARAKAALATWRLAIPDDAAARRTTDHFLLLGNVAEDQLGEIGESAEKEWAQVAKTFDMPREQPPWRGRLTVYVFANRYDFSEFGTMVEQRRPPKTSVGGWRFAGPGPYVLVCPPKDDRYTLPALLAEKLGGVAVAAWSGGTAPRWFSAGAGRAVASRLHRKDARVKAWNQQTREILSRVQEPAGFMTGKLPAEDADVLSYSFVAYLMRSGPRFQGLLRALREGTAFDDAVSRVYRRSPAELAKDWAARMAQRRR